MVARQLARANVIKEPFTFILYARARGADKGIKACEYEFESGLSAGQVLERLSSGACKLYKMTLIEGWTAREMAGYLALQPFASAGLADDFVNIVNANSLEGYLFPETYLIQRPQGATELVETLLAEFKKNFTPEFKSRAGEIGMSEADVVTLASIIEKEAKLSSERPFISAVFHNRLKKGMPLQADPTVIYGIDNFNGNITRADLVRNTPYNTYVHKGLPKGPISNPSLASIKAALWPAQSDYLYFVARGDGSHEFTTTYADHSKAVRKYQLK
jgi:UPF0755 protein